MREEMVAEGHLHGDLVSAVPASHRHDSVTTACQTDLSGEVSDGYGVLFMVTF